MKVLYVSKALAVAAYRAKLDALAAEVELRAVVPERWGREPVERDGPGGGHAAYLPAVFHGHNHLHLYRGIAALLERERPDLVHVDEEPYSLVTLQIAHLCRRRGVPSLFFAWQNLSKRLPPPFGLVRSRVFAAARGGIAGTLAAARVLRQAGFGGPLAVIPQFGVDPVRFAPDAAARERARRSLGVAPDELLVGFGGRLVPEKGADLLVRAVASLPGARLALIGDGPERPRLEALARGLGTDGRVSVLGHVASTDMPDRLRALDVLALPSRTTPRWAEQFGRILIEAMACGVAVVGARSGEIPHVIGDAGVLVPEGDADALRRALLALRDDPASRARLAARGRARVLERFTHARIVADTVRFYHALLSGAAEPAQPTDAEAVAEPFESTGIAGAKP